MIGNDIVDLQLAKTQSNWQRKGFLEKQFTMSEQKEILNSENPFLTVWLFWSMKEAAYKCYTQKQPKRFFAPLKFSCKTVSDSEGSVEIKANIYYVKYIISDSYVQSIAFEKNDKKMVSNLFFIHKNEDITKITNQNLISNFANDVKLQKNKIGVPYLVHQQKKLPVSISTSHHGNYGSYAISYQ